MYVCLCHGVSDKKIRKLVSEQGVTDIKGIKKCTALGNSVWQVHSNGERYHQ